jgi:hypothetical protein
MERGAAGVMIAPPPSLRTDDQNTAAVGANEKVASYSGISVVNCRSAPQAFPIVQPLCQTAPRARLREMAQSR